MAETLTCPVCKTIYETLPGKCQYCGYPFSGTEKEKSFFVAHQVLKQGEIAEADRKIKQAQIILFVVGIFTILPIFILFVQSKTDIFTLIISIGLGLFFIVFGLLARREPFYSILIPFCLLLLSYLVAAIMEPTTIFAGLLWKVIFIGVLSYSLISIRKTDKIKKESKYLASKTINK